MQLKGALVILLIAMVSPAMGQFRNVELGSVTSGPACEVSVAISPRRPENIVVRATPDQVHYSHDAGATWKQGTMTPSSGSHGAPTVMADSKGVFYCFQVSAANPVVGASEGTSESENPDRIILERSEDGGATWTAAESFGSNERAQQTRQSATMDEKGNFFVTWTQFNREGDAAQACTSGVQYSMSKNGKKWSAPVLISRQRGSCDNNDNTPMGAMPAVTIDGKIVIAWAQEGKIYLDRSFNGGDIWLSNDIVVQEQPGGWHMEIPGHANTNGLPVFIADKSKSHYRGSLYLVWSDQRNGEDDTDIWFTRSHNYGDNWSSAGRVNDDGAGRHQYRPSMAVDQATGYLYVMYYDRRNHEDQQTDVYLAWSSDGGTSFKNRIISDQPFIPGDGAGIAAHKGVIVPVWTKVNDDKTSVWTAIIKHEDLTKAPPVE